MKRVLAVFLLTLLISSSIGLGGSALPDKLSQRLRPIFESAPDEDEFLVWVYFSDKGPDREAKYQAALESLSPRCRQRRLKVRDPKRLVDFADLPLKDAYLRAIGQNVQRLRQSSRWLNGVSARATKRQINRIQSFDFVKLIDRVAGIGRPKPEPTEAPTATQPVVVESVQAQSELAFDYGASLPQLDEINVPAVHNLGNFGQGVVNGQPVTIGVFDTGFNLDHEAFANLNVIATVDFVNGDDDVSDGADWGRADHGTRVLSIIGGFAEGQLIGPAFAADYILAKTEHHPGSETPQEEDNWIAAVEWAEQLGVDIISSSVGYTSFDPPFEGYTWEDMDGQTAVITRGAVMAVQRGVVVVNAAGNSGDHPLHNTLMAPADGEGVMTVGAVMLDGQRAGFSSVGPTVDGRVKPDFMALGSGVRVADPHNRTSYNAVSGTSFATPLVAGAAALILSAHPDWSPAQVLQALRQTASNPSQPNKLIGWGIVDTLAAVQFQP